MARVLWWYSYWSILPENIQVVGFESNLYVYLWDVSLDNSPLPYVPVVTRTEAKQFDWTLSRNG